MASDFRDTDQALAAYKSAAIETWAVCNKKNIMQAGSGEDQLSAYFDLLSQYDNKITYTLRLYRNEEPQDVTDQTGCNSSFTFKTCDTNYAMGGFTGGGGGANQFALMQRIAGLEQKLKEAEAPKDKSSVWEKLGNTVLGWLEDPNDVVKMIGAIKMFTGKASQAEIMQTVTALGAVEPKRAGAAEYETDTMSNEQLAGELTPEQEQALHRYAHVIDRGEKVDPEFLLHLEGLVKLAETNPAMYKTGLSFLK